LQLNKRGLAGVTNILLTIIVIVVVVVSSIVFIFITDNKQRVISTYSENSAEDFLLTFLNSKLEINNKEITGEELVVLTSQGLDSSYLESKVESDLGRVCKEKCFATFKADDTTISVGPGKFKKEISASIDLPPKVEVSFYVPK
jgi:hypothetical protein